MAYLHLAELRLPWAVHWAPILFMHGGRWLISAGPQLGPGGRAHVRSVVKYSGLMGLSLGHDLGHARWQEHGICTGPAEDAALLHGGHAAVPPAALRAYAGGLGPPAQAALALQIIGKRTIIPWFAVWNAS